MTATSPMFGCGPVFTPAEGTLILCVLAAWLMAFLLSFANLRFIYLGRAQRPFACVHGAIFVAYLGLTVLLFLIAFGNVSYASPVVTVLPFAIPIVVIGHFVYLLGYRRKLNQKGE